MKRPDKNKKATPADLLEALSIIAGPLKTKNGFTDHQLMRALDIKQNLNMPELLSAKEAAKYLGVSPKSLANWRVSGQQELPFRHIGSRVFYTSEDLLKFATARTQKSTSE